MSDSETAGVDAKDPPVKEEGESSVGTSDTQEGQETKCVVMATLNLQPPSFVSEKKSYEEYKRELEGWALVTGVEKAKQALVVALSIPDETEGSIKQKIFMETTHNELNVEEGMKKLLDFLDKIYGKDPFVEAYEKYTKWNGLFRRDSQKVEEFLLEYNSVVKEAENKGIGDFEVIKAFKLLEASRLDPVERQLVFTGIDFGVAKEKKDIYGQMQTAIKKFKGEQSKIIQGAENVIDSVFISKHEEVLKSLGYTKKSKTLNPKNAKGEHFTCHICGSIEHFANLCPKKKKKKQQQQKQELEESLVTIEASEEEMCLEVSETNNRAVLDSACTSTVAGKTWFESYVKSLSWERRNKMKVTKSNKVFKFGDGEKKPSLESVRLPVTIAGIKRTVRVEVVDAEIPLLFSLDTMKKAKMIIDFHTDEAIVFGRCVRLGRTSIGHYSLPLNDLFHEKHVNEVNVETEDEVDSECWISISSEDKNEQRSALIKLHKQMGHLPITTLIKQSGNWMEGMAPTIKNIEENCRTCKLYAKTPAKPVVALSRAYKFNEVLSLDLKFWNGKIILYLIDQWSRLTVGVFIKSKDTSDVLNAIWMHWIAAGYGCPEHIHNDKGGEFVSAQMTELSERLGCKLSSTAGYAPHQNGVNERNHAVTDNCLNKIKEDFPSMKDEIVLAHAVFAKNSMVMTYGYSPLQLVFGQNPNLPNLSNATLPMLEESVPEGNVLRTHLNALHAARVAFIRSESDAKVKRALKHNVRNFSNNLIVGDEVFYKRKEKKWKGPGKIIAKDNNKNYWVSHGGRVYSVEGNVIVKRGEEFEASEEIKKDLEAESSEAIEKDLEAEGKQSEVKLSDQNEIQELIQDQGRREDETDGAVEEDGEHNRETGAVNEEADVNNNNIRVILKKNEKIRYKDDDVWREGTVISRAGKANGKYDGYYNVKMNDISSEVKVLNMNQISEWDKIESFTPETEEETAFMVFVPKEKLKDPEVREARKKQMDDWKRFEAYEEVKDEGQERIKGGWIDVYKEIDGKIGVKSRFVARGYMETEEIRSDSPTVSKTNIKVAAIVAAKNDWKLEKKDYRSAFLQGEELDRLLFMEPPPEEKKDGIIWRLKKAVYGLNDASRKWWMKCSNELLALGCERSIYDPAFFVCFKNEVLSGIVCLHVDDELGAGNEDFRTDVWDKLDERMVVGTTDTDDVISYVGLQVKHNEGCITLDQQNYVEKIECISKEDLKKCSETGSNDEVVNDLGQSLYRSKVGALNWLATQTRPDVAYEVTEFSSCFKKATMKNLKDVNKCIKRLKGEEVVIKFPKLSGDPSTWVLLVYSDGAFANLPDGVSSSGGHIKFLMDTHGNSAVLKWAVNKIQRVVRSPLASEALTMQEAISDAVFTREGLREVFGAGVDKMKIKIVIDSRSLSDAVHSTLQVEDKMLRINIAAIKQMIEKYEIQVVWKEGSRMIADALSKKQSKKDVLLEAVQGGRISADFY